MMAIGDGHESDPAPAIVGGGPCVTCGHDPACGYASVWTSDGGEQWYCHSDDHSCYVTSDHPSQDITPRPLGIGLVFNEDCDCCSYRHVHDPGFVASFHPEAAAKYGGPDQGVQP